MNFTDPALLRCPSAVTADKAMKCDSERAAMLAEIRRLTTLVHSLEPYVSKEFETRIATTAWNSAIETAAKLLDDEADLHTYESELIISRLKRSQT